MSGVDVEPITSSPGRAKPEEEDAFWATWDRCIKLIEKRRQDIDRLGLKEISYDQLEKLTYNELKKAKLEEMLAKETRHLEDLLRQFFDIRHSKDKFKYIEGKNKPPELQTLVKKTNAFLNDEYGNEPRAPEAQHLMQLAQHFLKNQKDEENVKGIVESLTQEAVKSVKKARKRKGWQSMLSRLSSAEAEDPAASDPALEEKLKQNRQQEAISTDDLLKAFQKNSKIYNIQVDSDEDDEGSSDSDEDDEGSSDSDEDEKDDNDDDEQCISELSAQVKKNITVVTISDSDDDQDDASKPSASKKSRPEPNNA